MKNNIISEIKNNLTYSDWKEVMEEMEEFYSSIEIDFSSIFKDREDQWVILGDVSKCYDCPYDQYTNNWSDTYFLENCEEDGTYKSESKEFKVFQVSYKECEENKELNNIMSSLYNKHVNEDLDIYPGQTYTFIMNSKGKVEILED